MSLLTNQTSSLLGIGEGSVQDFAAGIRDRRKASKGLSREEALTQATANEGQDARLQHSGDITPTHDPKKTQGAQLKLTTDDRNFIQAVNKLEKKIFKGENEIGKNNTEELKSQINGFLELAAQSSRGGLGEIWSNVYDRIKGAHGRTAPGGLAKLQSAFSDAREATNKVLDTSVDIDSYKFEAGRTSKVTIGNEKSFARKYAHKAAAGELSATNYFDNPDYASAGVTPLEQQARRNLRLEGGGSFKDLLVNPVRRKNRLNNRLTIR